MCIFLEGFEFIFCLTNTKIYTCKQHCLTRLTIYHVKKSTFLKGKSKKQLKKALITGYNMYSYTS